MDLALIIVIIGFLLNLYDRFSSGKIENIKKSATKKVFNKIPMDVIEKNMNPDVVDDIKEYIDYKDNKSNYYEDIYEEPVYLEDEEDEDITVVYNEICSDYSDNDIKRDINNFKNKTKKSSKKKNPFALTNNTVTNAIIASEILNKPKYKKKN